MRNAGGTGFNVFTWLFLKMLYFSINQIIASSIPRIKSTTQINFDKVGTEFEGRRYLKSFQGKYQTLELKKFVKHT